MVVQLHRMAFLNKYIAPEGWTFAPLSLNVVRGPPFFISFPGFTYIELQVYKLLPKSECRFYLGGMTLNTQTATENQLYTLLPRGIFTFALSCPSDNRKAFSSSFKSVLVEQEKWKLE